MGTGGAVPSWAMEIQLMEQFGWTERELYEDVSLETVIKIGKLNEMKGKANSVRSNMAKTSASVRKR